MLTAGIPLARALDSMCEQLVDSGARTAMKRIREEIRRGQPLSAAMAALPGVFTQLQLGVIRGAEASGRLPPALLRLHDYEERAMALHRRMRAVLTYPLSVFACAICLVLIIGRSMVTGMAPLLEQAKVEVNLVTRLAMALAKTLDQPVAMIVFVALFAAALHALARWLQTTAGRDWRDRTLLRTPIVARLLRRVQTARICEMLGLLYGSGLPVLQCLDLTARACDNVVARDAIAVVVDELGQGNGLSDSFARSRFFDRTVVQMIAMGEETGQLQLALGKIAQYNELEVQTALDQFAVAIEPLMFTFLGVVVGIIALVAFAPLYHVLEAMT